MQKRDRATAGGGARGSVFVDSSAWIAFFSARDEHHREAERMIRRAYETAVPLMTSNLVLAEIHRLLLFRAGKEAAAAALDRIETSARVTVAFPETVHHRTALGWLRKLPGPITYTDAVSFALMEAAGCGKVLSYDHHFLLAGFSFWQ